MAIDNQDDDLAGGTQEGPDFLNMSDDDMGNFDPSTMSVAGSDDEAGNEDGSVDESAEDKAATAAAAAALEDEDLADDGKGAGDEGQGDSTDDVGGSDADASRPADKAAVDKDGKPVNAKADASTKEKVEGDGKAKSGDEGAKDESGAVDYKAAYERLTAPFVANGKQIQVKSVDDAISLMQMGANYNKKMAGLKPTMKLVKMLEANGLLDESKLGFLIDVAKHDPAAINQLIVDSKIDPMDLTADKASEYKPGAHTVNDQEMELDAVLEEIKDSPTYTQTLQVVSTDWDQASRGEIVKSPQVLKVINDHIRLGIFDVIKAEVESERTFGRLKGLSDIAAYKQVGDAIQAVNGFDHLFKGSSQGQGKPAATAPVIVTPKPTQADEDRLKDRRKAASGTRAAATNKGVPADFNPLSMSDADFAKFK